MSDDRLPCPFCGELPDITRRIIDHWWHLGHQCVVVGHITLHWTMSREALVERWNTRAPVVAAPDLLDALKAARRFAMTAIQANVDVPDFDPAEHALIKKIDAALAKAEPSP